MEESLKGLELARRLYKERFAPLLESELGDLRPSMALGLVGEGSECFGYDDDISRDHDWGAAFCIWLPQELLERSAERLERALAQLPERFLGARVRMAPQLRVGRVGPLSLEGFYRRFLNVPGVPASLAEWRAVPEHYLAVATNGEVFEDGLGRFSEIRRGLLAFYPEDLRLKKIAARCVAASQAGQYNLPRMLARHDYAAVELCRGRFMEAFTSLVFLLHRRYAPFYKWAARAMAELSPLGAGLSATLGHLACLSPVEHGHEDFAALVEDLCQRVADLLVEQGLSASRDPWLYEQGPAVQARIASEALRRMPVQLE